MLTSSLLSLLSSFLLFSLRFLHLFVHTFIHKFIKYLLQASLSQAQCHGLEIQQETKWTKISAFMRLLFQWE